MSVEKEPTHEQVEQQRLAYNQFITSSRNRIQADAAQSIAANAAQNRQTSIEAAARTAEIIQNARSRNPKGGKNEQKTSEKTSVQT